MSTICCARLTIDASGGARRKEKPPTRGGLGALMVEGIEELLWLEAMIEDEAAEGD